MAIPFASFFGAAALLLGGPAATPGLAPLAVTSAGAASHAIAPMTTSSAGAPVVTPEEGAAGDVEPAPRGLDVVWYGQSCFLMRTPGKTTVLTDPVSPAIGYHPPVVKADLVTISHEHPDHDNLKMVEVAGAAAGGAEVIHGLTHKGWTAVDESVGDVHVTTLKSFHDATRGKKYGRNAIFIFDVGGKRIVHLGDLGKPLTPAQVKAIGTVDVLMVPIGGTYTLDAKAATQVIAALHPRYAIFPMHFRAENSKIKELAPPAAFLDGKSNVIHGGSHYLVPIEGPVPSEPVIVLLQAP